MAGGAISTKPRKRVEADSAGAAAMVRARDGSAFTRCEECKKDVPVALISFHSCSLDAKIKMNLEAQVVEQPSEPKKKSTERKKSTTKEPKAKKAKKGKDPNAPKRPLTAFFLFMEDFRKTFKEENPDDAKNVKRIAKEGGDKWKSMTEEEKKQYTDKAAELKAEYQKALENNTAEIEDDEGVSDKDEKEEDKPDEKDDAENDVKDDAEKDDQENPDKELEDPSDKE